MVDNYGEDYLVCNNCGSRMYSGVSDFRFHRRGKDYVTEEVKYYACISCDNIIFVSDKDEYDNYLTLEAKEIEKNDLHN